MSTRQIKYKSNTSIAICPKCGNNTEFTIRSEQVSEDCCDIWAICKCGYDPTEGDTGNRVEDTWGGVDDGNCQLAICYAWSETIVNLKTKINETQK